MDSENHTRWPALLLVIGLAGVFTGILVVTPEPAALWLAFSSAILVLTCGLLWGTWAGILSGFVSGLAFIWAVYLDRSAAYAIQPGFISSREGLQAFLTLALFSLSGLAAGFTTRRLLASRRLLQDELQRITEENRHLGQKAADYDQSREIISTAQVHVQAWSSLISQHNEYESVIGLLISSLCQKIRTDRRSILLSPAKSDQDPASPFDPVLFAVRPDLIAVLDLQGRVITANQAWLAILGQDLDAIKPGSRFFDVFLAADAARAEADLPVLIQGMDSQRRYTLRSSEGGFSALPVSPAIKLSSAGSPLVILAEVSREPMDPAYPDSNAFLAGLSMERLWCLAADTTTRYVSDQVAVWLSESAKSLTGKPAIKYVNRKDQKLFTDLLANLADGRSREADLVMVPHGGRQGAFHVVAWPCLGDQRQILGAVLQVSDITDRMAVADTLKHRLAMEQMISSISTRFIALPADAMDSAIHDVLRMLGEFEGAVESTIEIHPSGMIRYPVRYHVNHQTGSPKRLSSGLDRYETVSVPIVINQQSVGLFRFSLQRYASNWLDKDLELIRLAGEIIISALVRKENEHSIRINENRLATTLQSIGDAVIATDISGQIITMNRSAERLTGWSMAEARHRQLDEVMQTSRPLSGYLYRSHDKDEESDEPERAAIQAEDIQLWTRHGESPYIAVTCSAIEDEDGHVYGEVVVFRDITSEKKEADEIRYISYHDSLTGLYNRAFFEEELKRLNTRRQYPITLILGDCNGLKIANDVFGHLEGDKLLKTIADILRKATRQEDIVARWGGDEFAIILPKTDEATASSVRERILALCSVADPYPILPSLALGSATNSDYSGDLQGLLKLAEDRMYRHKLMEGKSARNAILQSIKKMIYEKSYETEEHASRMINIANRFGRAVGLTIDEMEELSLLAVLHDMGKIGIPDNILCKQGKLSPDEWEIMKKHPEKGYNIAKATPELTNIAKLILHHHERWDGTGYPDGLSGRKIPKLSRILALIDTYDVITHHRAYKKAQTKEYALSEITRCAGTQFDPELARIFVLVLSDQMASAEEAAPAAVSLPDQVGLKSGTTVVLPGLAAGAAENFVETPQA